MFAALSQRLKAKSSEKRPCVRNALPSPTANSLSAVTEFHLEHNALPLPHSEVLTTEASTAQHRPLGPIAYCPSADASFHFARNTFPPSLSQQPHPHRRISGCARRWSSVPSPIIPSAPWSFTFLQLFHTPNAQGLIPPPGVTLTHSVPSPPQVFLCAHRPPVDP